MKILGFALLLLCIPQLCFLSFQQRASKQSKVCIIKDDNDENESLGRCETTFAAEIKWSTKTLQTATETKSWIAAQTIVTSLTCLLSIVSLSILLYKQRADAIERASQQIDVQ